MPENLTPAFLVDIDGTLANTDHRMHLLPRTEEDRNNPAMWHNFHSQMHLDTPYLPVFEFIRERSKQAKAVPVVITGRPIEFQRPSSQWLVKYNFLPYFSIYRRDDNKISDIEYKADALQRMRHEGYWPVIAIDDQPHILDMWRQHNIKTTYLAIKGQVERIS